MGRAQSKPTLRQSIAEILGTGEPAINTTTRPGPLRKSLIYGSMALLTVNPAQVSAVGLGELSVTSRLGQPLNATVPVTLAPGESLPKNCIAPTRGSSGIGTPKNLRVTTPAASRPGTYNLRVTTTNPLHEPMYEISLIIDCPGTPLLLRQYVLMLDLPVMTMRGMNAAITDIPGINNPVSTANQGDTLFVPSPAALPLAQPVKSTTTATPVATTAPRTERTLQQSQDAIPAGKSYRISKGDTLSTIAARVDGRDPDTIWSVAKLIFTMNPQAFIRNNPDLIKLGSKIDIPDISRLVGLAKGRTTIVSAAATPTASRPEPVSEPRRAPVPAPTPTAVVTPATTNRQEAFVSEPNPEQRVATTQDNAIEISAPIATVTDLPVAVQPAETAVTETPIVNASIDGAVDVETISPFLDEQPTPPVTEESAEPVIESATDTAVQPAPVVATTNSESSDAVNPLLAILVGMLLGLAASFLVFRRQIISAFSGILRRRAPAAAVRTTRVAVPSKKQADNVITTETVAANGFDPTEANAAFDTPSAEPAFDTSDAASAFESQQDELEPLPIKEAMENTYIVETSVAETTMLDDVQNSAANSLENLGELPANPDDEMLAQLFDESSSSLDGLDNEIFDPTVDVDAAAADTFADPAALRLPDWDDEDEQGFDPTVEMPKKNDHESLDPTAVMPTGSHDVLLDETGEMPVDSDEALIPELADSLDAALEDFDADELFATSDKLTSETQDGSSTDDNPDSPTVTSHRAQLSSSDEDEMSQSLQEAMSLLEKDFNDEFTASQILERSEISRLLGDEPADDTEDTDLLPDQKVSS